MDREPDGRDFGRPVLRGMPKTPHLALPRDRFGSTHLRGGDLVAPIFCAGRPHLQGDPMSVRQSNHFLETNRLLVSALGAGTQLGRAVHAQASIFRGGRSGKRYAG